MSVTEGLGWVAAALVFSSFYLKTMTSLRLVAVCSNVAFIAYALSVGATPILVLHLLLLPLNIFRLAQNFYLKNRVRNAVASNAGSLLILPYMNRVSLPAGSILYTKGCPSDQIFYIVEGMVELVEQGEKRGHGELLGLMGVFALGGIRLDTAISSTPVQLGVLSLAEVERALMHDHALNRFLLKTLAEIAHKHALRSAQEYPTTGFLSPYTPQGASLH
jgi:hypothetical protein